MNEVERRTVARALVVLVVVSGLRWGWQVRPGALPPPSADAAPALLEATDARVTEEERRTRPLAPGERVDPNRAPAVELDRLPGVGPATAAAIVAVRDSLGGFERPEDLRAVPGIGPVTVSRMADHLDFPGTSPLRRSAPPGDDRVDLNRADAAELQRLPGVGPALAERIVEARTTRRFRTLEDLLAVRGIGPATLARLRDRASVSP